MFRRASWQRARRMRRPLPPACQEVLERRLSIYRRLPRAEQQALAGLTQVLMGEVGFEAGIGLDRVDMPMRLMIAGQIALGLLHRPLAQPGRPGRGRGSYVSPGPHALDPSDPSDRPSVSAVWGGRMPAAHPPAQPITRVRVLRVFAALRDPVPRALSPSRYLWAR